MASTMLMFVVSSLLSTGQSTYVLGCNEDPIVRYIGDYLQVTYEVIENNFYSNGYLGRLNLTNSGSKTISQGNWAVYFSHTRSIALNGVSHGLRVKHHNGVLYWLEPTEQFAGVDPSQSMTLTFNGSDWMISRTDALPNWYAVSRGDDCSDAYLIRSTIGESLDYVAPFETSKQWKRVKGDRYDPLTPLDRYTADNVKDLKMAAKRILPTPMNAEYGSTSVNLVKSSFVVVEPENPSIQNEARLISEKLGLTRVPANVAPEKNTILLQIGANSPNVMKKSGSYSLKIDSSSVVIAGFDPIGVFYAVQSLLSLADSTISGEVPLCTISDGPRFEHRGQHIDVARNFHTVDDLKRLMDGMALYKLNRLHIHLGDDEGWRLEIPGIEELTQVGGQRCHDPSGNMCIMPQLGSSPTLPNAGSGYYTVDDYKAILSYANDRHILVIPEFDMPGHSHAAVNSMLARHRKYSTTNLSRAEEYLLTDLDDASSYLSVQYFTDNAINPCLNSTYAFIEKVMSEVKLMHQEIQPLLLYHIGGDEVAVGAWVKSPRCLAQFGATVTQTQVKRYFLQRFDQILANLNLSAIGWEDGLTLGGKVVRRTELFSQDTWVNAWDNVWEWGTGGRAYAFANAGYKVVLSHATHLFFDFPSEPDPEERGYYWATRAIPLRKAFGYRPDDVYGNMDVDRMGNDLDRSIICAPADDTDPCPALHPDSAANIVGMQSQAWGETIRTSDDIDYMIFPRILALAERSWHKADWESVTNAEERNVKLQADWEEFANTLGHKELRRLDDINIKYRVPLVGASVSKDSTIEVTSGLPGLAIEYKESNPGSVWKTLEGSSLKTDFIGTIEFRTRSANGKRFSRPVSVPLTSVVNAASQLISASGVWIFTVLFRISWVNYSQKNSN